MFSWNAVDVLKKTFSDKEDILTKRSWDFHKDILILRPLSQPNPIIYFESEYKVV